MRAMERAVSRSTVFTRWTGIPVERSMPTAKFLRDKARECRKLLAIATVPEVWARDFDD